MKLTRKTIIENIYRLNYEKIEMDKENSMNWAETLSNLAILDYNQLLKNYISELEYNFSELEWLKVKKRAII